MRARGAGRRRDGTAGQGLVEYGLILVLAAIVALVALLFFGGTLGAVLSVIVSWVGTST